MSTNTFVIQDVSPEEVEKVVLTIQKLLKIGKGLAMFTPTQLDDALIEKVEMVVNMVAPYASEEWFLGLLNLVFGMFKKGEKPEVILAKLQAMVA